MAASTILTVLANIPWGQVIDNAPKLAEGASKLWQTVARRTPARKDAAGGAPTDQTVQTEAQATAQRLRDLEQSVAALEEQMRASVELIQSLAEQNSQLIQRVERHRRQIQRQRWTLVLAVVLGMVWAVLAHLSG